MIVSFKLQDERYADKADQIIEADRIGCDEVGTGHYSMDFPDEMSVKEIKEISEWFVETLAKGGVPKETIIVTQKF